MINPHIIRKTTSPVSAPPEAGIHWINTSTGDEFFSVGTSTVADWKARDALDTANYLATTGAGVNVSLASPPSTGQVLQATSATTATWQTPASYAPSDTAFGISWDGVTTIGPSKNAVYDAISNVDNTSDANKPISIEGMTANSTGVKTGGVLSIGAPNTTFSISDGTGAVTVNHTGSPTHTPVSWSGKTNITATYVASGLVSYVAIDASGTVIQQLLPFTQTQSRSLILLGSLVHVNLTNLDAVNNFQDVILSPANMVHDLSHSLGIFNVNGNVFSANGANLNLNKSVGKVYAVGSNWAVNVLDPSNVVLGSLTALTFQYRFQNGTNGATGTVINPNIYDLAGVSTPVPTNKFTIQRIYSFVSNNVKIQPGQTIYNSLAEAKAAIQIEVFVTETSIASNGLLRGFLAVQEGTTSLQSATNAFFLGAPKFGGTAGVGGLSVSTLQNAYDNSTSPEILTDSTRGALSVRRGSAADTNNIIEGLNNASSITFSVTGAGVVTASSYSNNLSAFAATTSAQLAGVISDETGTGALVFASSPTLVTPALGTPSALVGTNITGTAAGLTAGTVTTNANLTGKITSVGNATSLGSFTSAELATALTNETGTGVAVFNNTPTLIAPLLGTPTSGVMTNVTGTAAGLTAGNVTTNANLTGHITSVGNAAVLGSFTSAQLLAALTDETGTGVNVFNTSPTFLTSLITSSATFTLFNTNATTVTAFGSATTMNIGASTATSTHNYSPNATLSGNTKTVNLGTAGASGSTTNINIGSAVGGALGTTTLNQAVVLSSTLNNLTVTAPATAATLTLADNSSLITNGGFSTTLITTGATSVTLPTTGKLATEEVSIINALIFG